MKKFLILCSVLFGFAVTGLMADEAVAAPATHSTVAASGSHAQRHHHHRGHHHHHRKH